MKEKYGIFTLSRQSSGYGTMYVITDANGRVYSSSYHAQDELKRLNGLQKTNPFSRFFGGGTTQYTILPIYSEPAGYTFGFGGFGGQQQEPQSPYLKSIEYGVFLIESGSNNEYKIKNISGSIMTKFPSMSIAYDYIQNIPNQTLEEGTSDFVILPIYRYNKP